MTTLEEQTWSFHTIDAFKPVPEDEDWKECPTCGVRPRTWRFNNGCHAKCQCSKVYGPEQARAESVMSYVKRNNGSLLHYGNDNLRIAWNKYVETGIPQIKLPEGQW